MKKKQAVAWALCALLCLALAFSACYIAAEANHDCIGESCPVCLEMQACVSLLSGLGLALVFVFAGIAPRHAPAATLSPALYRCASDTLISTKVKLTI